MKKSDKLNWVIFTFFNLLFVIFLISFVSANSSIHGKIYKVYSDNNEGFRKENFNNLVLRFYFTDRQVFDINVSKDGSYSLPFDKIYCWKNCNIYPSLSVDRVEIVDGGKVIGFLPIPVSNEMNENFQNASLDSGVFVDMTEKFSIPEKSDFRIDNNDSVLRKIKIVSSSNAVYWNGAIYVDKDDFKDFKLNIGGGVKVYLNDKLVLDNFNNNGNTFSLNLKKGLNNLSLVYFYSSNEIPKLLWKDNGNFVDVPKENLLFYYGGTKFGDISIFEHKLNGLNPKYSLAETYTFTYRRDTPTLDKSQIPLLLVYGLYGNTGSNSGFGYWGNIPQNFVDRGRQVWEIDYLPDDGKVAYNAVSLSSVITAILYSYDTGYYTKKVDLVAHSMGGLISRNYINNLAKDSNGNSHLYNNDVRSLVMVGTPNYGSHISNEILSGSFSCTGVASWFCRTDSPAHHDIAAGSQIIWDNYISGLQSGINYLVIAGIDDDIGVGYGTFAPPFEAKDSDSIVSASSASLLNFNVPLILIHANHRNEHGICFTPAGISKGERCHYYGYDDTMTDLINHFLIDGSLPLTDLYPDEWKIYNSNPPLPYTQGSILIKFAVSPSSVYLKSGNNIYSLTQNPDSGIWYHFNDNSNAVDRGLTLPSGTYELYADGVDSQKQVEIKSLQTTVYEIKPQTSPTCSLNSDCGTDGFSGNPFCQNNNVYQNYIFYMCVNPGQQSAYCTNSQNAQLKQDCGDNYDEVWGANYCKTDGNVYHSRTHHDKGCSSTSCYDSTSSQEQLVQSCQYGCNNGVCANQPICSPGEKRCNVNNIETCKQDGSGWISTVNCGMQTICVTVGQDVACSTCPIGSLNCDQNPSTGCEINSLSDNNNCGGCGIICSNGKSCNNGVCVSQTVICSSDSQCNDNNPNTQDVCINPGTTSSYCQHNGIITCSKNLDCGNDGYVGNNYCEENIYRDYISYTCSNPGTLQSSCYSTLSSQLITNCQGNGCEVVNGNVQCKSPPICNNECSFGQFRCNGNYQQTCGNYDSDSCLEFGGDQYCSSGCNSNTGICNTVAVKCYSNSDCGSNGYVGNNYCDNNVFQNYANYTCNNPGSQSSTCILTQEPKLKEICQYGCNSGVCKSPPLIQVSTPNSGVKWSVGSTKKIRWISDSSIGSKVKIYLYRNGGFERSISGGAKNTGVYKWKIPKDLINANNYQICVLKSDKSIKGCSDNYFSIVK